MLIISDITYNGEFSLVQIFAVKRPDSSEEIFSLYILADAERSSHTPVIGHASCETGLIDEAKKQPYATTA